MFPIISILILTYLFWLIGLLFHLDIPKNQNLNRKNYLEEIFVKKSMQSEENGYVRSKVDSLQHSLKYRIITSVIANKLSMKY